MSETTREIDSENGKENSKKKPKMKKKAKICSTIWENFVDFSQTTSINGLSYLGEKNLHRYERAFWVLVFIISTVLSSWMIFELFEKWQNSPVIVSFNEKSKPNWQIPFPAVTICPEIKAYKKIVNFTKIYNMIKENKEVDEEDLRNYAAMFQFCDEDMYWYNKTKIPSDLPTNDIRRRLIDISLNVSDVFSYCTFRNIYTKCNHFFHSELTADGVCFTFNNLYLDDVYQEEALNGVDFMQDHKKPHTLRWNLDDGYSTKKLHTYPNRILGIGTGSGLNVGLKFNNKDFDYICRGPTQGFKVQLHPPNELPNVKNNFFHVPLEQDVMVNVKPQVMETSEGLRSYKPEERQCYYSYESKLKFFKSYTKTNCEIECSANFTLIQCGCVHMSMPHVNGTRICGFSDTGCLWRSQYFLSLLETGNDFESLTDFTEDENNYVEDLGAEDERKEFLRNLKKDKRCGCLPSCTSISYEVEVTQTEFKEKKFQKNQLDTDEVQTMLSIYFNTDDFFPSKRSELYGVVDFIANCGGLLGLFMGVSFISVIEIFYFLLVRPAFKAKMQQELKEQGVDEQLSDLPAPL